MLSLFLSSFEHKQMGRFASSGPKVRRIAPIKRAEVD